MVAVVAALLLVTGGFLLYRKVKRSRAERRDTSPPLHPNNQQAEEGMTLENGVSLNAASSVRNNDNNNKNNAGIVEMKHVKNTGRPASSGAAYSKSPVLLAQEDDTLYYNENINNGNGSGTNSSKHSSSTTAKRDSNVVNSWKPMDDVTVMERLGGGNFGDVYKGIWAGTTLVALKRLKSAEQMQEFSHEASVLQSLVHPNIVQYLGVFTSPENNEDRFIVTEFLSLGSLLDLLRSRGTSFSSKVLVSMHVTRIASFVQPVYVYTCLFAGVSKLHLECLSWRSSRSFIVTWPHAICW